MSVLINSIENVINNNSTLYIIEKMLLHQPRLATRLKSNRSTPLNE